LLPFGILRYQKSVNLDQKKKDLEQQRKLYQQEYQKSKKLLENPHFLQKAVPSVVAKAREKLTYYQKKEKEETDKKYPQSIKYLSKTVHELKVEEIRLPKLSEITDEDGKVKLPPELIEKLRDLNARFRTDLIVCPFFQCHGSGCTGRKTDLPTLTEVVSALLEYEGANRQFAAKFLKSAKEFYIEKSGYSALLALDGIIDDKPDFVLENLQENGIRIDDCPEELMECLINIQKVLTNNGKEFVERVDREASEDIAKMTPEERRKNFYQTFTLAQKLMSGARTRQKNLEGKTYKDVEMKNQFSGDHNQGKENFERLASKINTDE
ncbi:3610_t:CDS:2, partial [Funneliformis geosporum]